MKRVHRLLLTGALCVGSGAVSNLHINIDVVFFIQAGQMRFFENL